MTKPQNPHGPGPRAIINPTTDLLSIGAKYEISEHLGTHPELLTLSTERLTKYMGAWLQSQGFPVPEGPEREAISRYIKKLKSYGLEE